ncbi:hypothetical protein QFX18_00215 [Saccharophagus degradans]|uniref:hypothetical protein n=1 Tax=Saccharophagus degradans TaxID=86304 RepID=UPI0024781239|nr:hypothetical protein [Saccharophagus degradans]WGO98487.1 hypothetical protein QFX18_00215 [Saccharophagus degradans]
MFDLHNLYLENPKKHDELSAFHWFAKSICLEYESLVPTERPDFIVDLGNKKIGIEITLAQRNSPLSNYPSQQIEAAQTKFSISLLQSIKPNIPLNVGLVFEDGVAVDMKQVHKIQESLALYINEISGNMTTHSVELIIRSEGDMCRSKHRKHIFPALPAFLQYIQLLNDGYEESVVTGARGGFLDSFTEADLFSILEKKHRTLTGYQKCDEQWLVIVSGLVPPLFMEHTSRPNVLLASIATSFAGVDAKLPLKSDFDRVYFFNSPTYATRIT